MRDIMNSALIGATALYASLIGAQVRSNPTALIVDHFSVENATTQKAIERLAGQVHVPIGITGELLGFANERISVEMLQTTLGAILDEICKRDSRYKWTMSGDGTIRIIVGTVPTSFTNISVKQYVLRDVRAANVTGAIAAIPEVRRWSEKTGCRVGRVWVVTGEPSQSDWQTTLEVHDQVLWQVLDELAERSGTYFWSAIKISDSPCQMNLIALNRK